MSMRPRVEWRNRFHLLDTRGAAMVTLRPPVQALCALRHGGNDIKASDAHGAYGEPIEDFCAVQRQGLLRRFHKRMLACRARWKRRSRGCALTGGRSISLLFFRYIPDSGFSRI